MGIHESDTEKTAFKTVDGLFEFNTITMGLTNAPSVFQSMMNDTFKGLEFCVIIYLDDILVFSRNEDDHIREYMIGIRKITYTWVEIRLMIKSKGIFIGKECLRIFWSLFRNVIFVNCIKEDNMQSMGCYSH